jgi:hypothetical protein
MGIGGASGGRYPPTDLRGQGGGNRDSYQQPHEGTSRAKYDAATEDESEGVTRPGLYERLKRWFSGRF